MTSTIVARLDRLRANRDGLRQSLPDSAGTEDDYRQLAVWYNAEHRYIDHYCQDIVMSIFTDLAPDYTGREDRHERNPGLHSLDELGERLKVFVDFVATEIAPRIYGCELGLRHMAALPYSDEGDRTHRIYLRKYLKYRREIARGIPVGWTLAAPAARLYEALPKDLQDEAERRWGPLHAHAEGNFGPLWRTHFPIQRLKDLDEAAKKEGLWPMDQEYPYTNLRRRKHE